MVWKEDATIITHLESLGLIVSWAVLRVEQVYGEKSPRYPQRLKSARLLILRQSSRSEYITRQFRQNCTEQDQSSNNLFYAIFDILDVD